jgi:hypothetical protein
MPTAISHSRIPIGSYGEDGDTHADCNITLIACIPIGSYGEDRRICRLQHHTDTMYRNRQLRRGRSHMPTATSH